MKVVLDTNFLIDAIRFKIDLDNIKNLIHSCTLTTLDSVVEELERISKGSSHASRNAKVALKLIKEYQIEILKSKEKNVDKSMLAIDAIIATNDKNLRKKLKSFGKKSIYLKSKKELAIG